MMAPLKIALGAAQSVGNSEKDIPQAAVVHLVNRALVATFMADAGAAEILAERKKKAH